MIDLSLPPSFSSILVIVSAGAWIVSEMTYNKHQHRYVVYLLTQKTTKIYARGFQLTKREYSREYLLTKKPNKNVCKGQGPNS